MRYLVEVRSVVNPREERKAKFARFLAGLGKLAPPWSGVGSEVELDESGDFIAHASAASLFPVPEGDITLADRSYLKDSAEFDDALGFSIEPLTMDFRAFVYDVFPGLMSAFDGYYGEIADQEFIRADLEQRRALKIDARFSIYRLAPVTLISEQLCKRAFGMTASQVAMRLAGAVEHVSLRDPGVLIIQSSRPLSFDEAARMTWATKSLLKPAIKRRWWQ